MRIHWIALFAIIFLTSLAIPMKTVHSLETQATPDDTTPRTPYNTQTTSPVEFISSFGGVQNTVAVDAGYAYMGEGAGLRIVNVRNTATPVSVAYLPLSDIPADIQIANGYVYTANESGLQIIDVRDVTKPMVVSNLRLGTSLNLYVIDNLAYVAAEENGLQIIDISIPTDPTVIGSYLDGQVHDVQVVGTYAYIVQKVYLPLDALDTFVTLDVQDPTNPIPQGSIGIELVHQLIVIDTIAYATSPEIPAIKSGQLYAIDVSNPMTPTIRGEIDVPRAKAIEVANGYAYIPGGGMTIVDVSDPTNLQEVGQYETTVTDISVVDGAAYTVGNGLEIVNIVNPSTPTQQGQLSSVSDQVRHIGMVGEIAYVTNDADLYLLDARSMTTPLLLGQYSMSFIKQVVVDDAMVYLVGTDEIHLVDVSDPTKPVLSSRVDIPEVNVVAVQDNRMYVHTFDVVQEANFFIFDISNPAEPQQLERVNLENLTDVTDIVVIGNRVYMINTYFDEDGLVTELHLIDIVNPEKPVLIDSYETNDLFRDMKIIDNQVYVVGHRHLYVFDGDGAIRLINKTTLSRNNNENGADIQVHNDIAYVIVDYVDTDTNIQLFDVSNPAQPTRLGQINTQGDGHDLHIDNGLVYIANGDAGVRIIRVQPEQLPPEIFLPIVQS
ncbi:MAG: hypothetical protein AAGF95_32010 [Chloroflexota bacterium]